MHFYDRFLKLAALSLLTLILALLPVGAFAMGKGGTGGTGGTGGAGGTGGGGGTGGTPTACAGTAGDPCDVIVVGAGPAGLYATVELTNMGFDVKVLEAQDDHGGRTSDDGGNILGTTLHFCAEGVTGKKKANWHYHDINSFDSNILVDIYPDDGTHTTAYNFDGSGTTGWDAGKKDFPELFDYWDFYYNADEYTGPDVNAEVGICDYKGICKDDPVTGVYWHLYDAGYPGGEFSTSPKYMGMRSLAIQEGLWVIGAGEFGFKYSSWGDTLDALYFNPILSKVQLESPVTAIDTSVSPAAVTATGVGAGTYYAHAVLVTVPIGILQGDEIDFNPDLSAAKQTAINQIGAGNGGKFFLKFNSTVWDSSWVGIHTPGLAGYCWSLWYREGEGPNDVLVCYPMGENAEALAAMATDQDRIDAVLASLDVMPNQKKGTTQFTDAFQSGFWARGTERPYVKGVYSFPKIGSYPSGGGQSAREILAEPVGTSLYFAGEATHNEHSATVFGALDSGLRAAAEIDADHTPQ
jgi:hypothetical protein